MGLRMRWEWALIVGCWGVCVTSQAMADEYAKQPPLEIPKALLDGDAAEPSRPDPVKKTSPKAADAVAKSDAPAKTPKTAKASESSVPSEGPSDKAKSEAKSETKAPVRDLKGLPEMAIYPTKPGESVDKILQTVYAGSPIRLDVLRDALVQNNPKAFPKGHAKSMVKGAILSLPDPMALAQRLMLPMPTPSDPVPVTAAVSPVTTVTTVATVASAAAPVSVATPAVPAGGGGAAAHSSGRLAGQNVPAQDPRRSWVRYP